MVVGLPEKMSAGTWIHRRQEQFRRRHRPPRPRRSRSSLLLSLLLLLRRLLRRLLHLLLHLHLRRLLLLHLLLHLHLHLRLLR